MKKKMAHLALGLMLGVGLFAVAESASARCWTTGGYWHYGRWYGGHTVCDRNYHRAAYRCKWVGGYYGRHGVWHRGHRVCY